MEIDTQNRLKLGLPSGSLEKATLQFLEKAGFRITIAPRSHFALMDDGETECLLVRAQEIARYVEEGIFDVGFTGRDWILESGADVVECADLKYAKQTLRPIRWILAVPRESDIQKVQDLEGKRVATELVTITRRYLMENGIHAEVEFSWGATEVKTPLLVDAIVDATETGNSLKANGLRVVDTVLESTTRLVANHRSWDNPWKREKIRNLATLVLGAVEAAGRVGLKMNVSKECIEGVLRCLPSMKLPTISPLYQSEWVALEAIIEEKQIPGLVPLLKKCGAKDIIEYPLNKVI